VQSADQKKMRSPQLEYFTRTGRTSRGGGTVANQPGWGRVAVVVEQGDRRGYAGARLYYTARRKNVLTGGKPSTFRDPVEGTHNWREWTFDRAD